MIKWISKNPKDGLWMKFGNTALEKQEILGRCLLAD